MVSSAGILLYRVDDRVVRVLIAHMGGPFWARKDNGGWSIPKGEYAEAEEPMAAAAREFAEEMGSPLPAGTLEILGTVRQSSGKRVTAFALAADFDADHIRSNLFELEWPKGSGQLKSFPEIDRAAWFDCATARSKLVKGQVPFLDLLIDKLRARGIDVAEAG